MNFRAALLATLCSQVAHAAISNVLFVVVPLDDEAERDALEFERTVAAALSADQRLELVDPTLRYASAANDRVAKQLADAKQIADEVASLVSQLEFEAAKPKAEAALSAVREADLRVLKEQYVRLLVQLARIKLALKDADGCRAELTKAFTIDPALAAPRDLNKAEREAFAGAQKATSEQAAARAVTVRSTGPAAMVWVDGQYVGVTPVTVSDAKPGRHFITAVAPGSQPELRSDLFGSVEGISVSPGVSADGRSYRGALASLASGLKRGDPRAAAQELRDWAKADEVIAVGLSSQRKATVYRLATAGAVGPTELQLGDNARQALSDAVRAAFDAAPAELKPGASASTAPTPVSTAVEAEAPQKSRVPGVVVVVAGAALIAGGVGLAIAAQGANRDALMTPQADDATYKQKLGSANGLAGASIGVIVAGVVAAGVGVVLAF